MELEQEREREREQELEQELERELELEQEQERERERERELEQEREQEQERELEQMTDKKKSLTTHDLRSAARDFCRKRWPRDWTIEEIVSFEAGAKWQREVDAEICESVDIGSNGFSPQQVKLDCAYSIRKQYSDESNDD